MRLDTHLTISIDCQAEVNLVTVKCHCIVVLPGGKIVFDGHDEVLDHRDKDFEQHVKVKDDRDRAVCA